MEYSITVEFNSQTVSDLNDNQYTLIYFISSFSNSSSSAIPLCCGLVDTFLTSLEIKFKDDLFAYVSNSHLDDKQEIFISQTQTQTVNAAVLLATTGISSSCSISLGQTFTLNSDLTVKITSNSTNNIVIQSDANKKFTSGIGIIDNSSNPYYRGINAQILYKPSPLNLTPGSKILLAIIPNNSIKINMAVKSLSSQFIVIDLSSNPTPPPTVTYSLLEGWQSNDLRVKKYTDGDLSFILIKNYSGS